jgi:hypothetical protein
MHFIPILIQDLKKPLLCVLVHHQHANSGAKQHRLDQIWSDTFEFAMGDCILEVIDRQNLFWLLLVEQIGRLAEPRSGCVRAASIFAIRFSIDVLHALSDKSS